ncbi:glycosyltransferase [Citrobacter freundii]|uniref:glycosyltransferase n=1 Tax=Citrobacter freundii TaxID=546 RepID=UPI002B36BF94|nr:glycosyltransferase [Citrobacter freundii]
MKNIVFVVTKAEIGGAQKWILEQTSILKNEYNVFIVTSSEGWLTEHFDKQKIFLIPSLISLFSIRGLIQFSAFLKYISADIVVSSSANAGLLARMSKLFYRHRSIYVSHGWSCIYNGGRFKKIYCFIEKILSYMTDVILCVSEMDKINAINVIGIPEQKIRVIKNAVLPIESNKVNNAEKDVFKVLYLGRMCHPKRPELLARVVNGNPRYEAHFFGDGEYLDHLKDEYKTSKNIIFHGSVYNFNDFNNYDIFVLASDSEGLPMSAIEAGVAGTPLLLSNVGGCSELIYFEPSTKCHNGRTFLNDVQSLQTELDEISSNFLGYALSAQALKFKFDLNLRRNEYIDLYNNSLD